MIRSTDAITEIVKSSKNTFPKADERPVKAQKHRYERRKVKEFLKIGDWVEQNPA